MGMIDIGIIALVFLSSVIGIFRGFVREVLSLVALVAAFYIAWTFQGELLTHLSFIEPELLRKVAAFLGIFFIVLVGFSLINYVIAKLMDSTGLSGTDRLLGVIFGVIRGAAIVMILIVLSGLTPIPDSNPWKKSTLIPHFQQAGQWLKGYLPADFAKYLDVPVITGEISPADQPEDEPKSDPKNDEEEQQVEPMKPVEDK